MKKTTYRVYHMYATQGCKRRTLEWSEKDIFNLLLEGFDNGKEYDNYDDAKSEYDATYPSTMWTATTRGGDKGVGQFDFDAVYLEKSTIEYDEDGDEVDDDFEILEKKAAPYEVY